jgi:hypothetical protein
LGFALLAAPIGGVVGGLMGIDEKIVLEGKSPEEIEHILKKLNSKSRFPVKSLQKIKKTNSKAKKEA